MPGCVAPLAAAGHSSDHALSEANRAVQWATDTLDNAGSGHCPRHNCAETRLSLRALPDAAREHHMPCFPSAAMLFDMANNLSRQRRHFHLEPLCGPAFLPSRSASEQRGGAGKKCGRAWRRTERCDDIAPVTHAHEASDLGRELRTCRDWIVAEPLERRST